VHIRENLTKQRLVCRRVAQRRPISTGNIAALGRLLPEGAYRVGALRVVESVYRDAVTAVERLVHHFCAVLTLAGDPHSARVQIVLRRGRRLLASELDQDMPQFGGRQAGADDRAVEVGGKVPQLPATRRRGDILLRRVAELSRPSRCNVKP